MIKKCIKYGVLIGWALLILLPLITIIFGSFKTLEEFNTTAGIVPPQDFTYLENYKKVWLEGEVLRGFTNTFIITLLSIMGNAFIGSTVAYALSRFEWKYKKLLLGTYLLMSIVPLEIAQVATFRIIDGLGIYNTIWAPIMIYIGADVLSVYIYLQAMEKIPYEIDKAMMLEGTSYFTIYRKVIFPLVLPATGTICTLKVISIYNDFYIPFLYMPSPEHRTISTTMFNFIGEKYVAWQVICAGVVISMIPMLIFFIVLQKYIYRGLLSGSIR